MRDASPVIDIRGAARHYVHGDVVTKALDGVDFVVQPGEMVAIVGTSGSGKSTLLNLIGCLDRPTAGSYHLTGHDVSALDIVDRARVRGWLLGFVFQGFHLLPGTSALESVELPLLYQGVPAEERRARALRALDQVGLSDRVHHTPNQLSGGQQQRVAIARALATEPEVLLADEPTGNLDSKTSEEVIGLLQQLNRQGLTVVLVTHDAEVARAATRIVRMRDGTIERDDPVPEQERRVVGSQGAPTLAQAEHHRTPPGTLSPVGLVGMGLQLALKALWRSKLRAALTTLGILIGIAAVVTTSAIGAGAKERMEQEMLSLGANMLVVMPERHFTAGARSAGGSGHGLTQRDGEAIAAELPSAKAVAPSLSASVQAVAGASNVSTRVTGTTPAYLDVRGWTLAEGTPFTDADVDNRTKVCVIGHTVKTELFAGQAQVVGETVRVGRMPCSVIGVLTAKGQSGMGSDQDDIILMPISTTRAHVSRRSGDDVDALLIAAADAGVVNTLEQNIDALLRERHHIAPDDDEPDFSVRNLAELMSALDAQRSAIAMLLLVVASVSLLVGGIGVMNIMLVSVTERVREIGIRLAIGARPVDILVQFLLEAVVLAGLGGLVGLALGVGASAALDALTGYRATVQVDSALLAMAISGGLGVVFGFFPAQRASRLDPITALRRE